MPLTSTLERTPPPLPGKTVDNTLPTVGGGLAVVTDSETSSGFSLSWTKGSDDQTVEENLKYLVYISDQDNITGVSNAENNGTLLNPDEQDQLDRNTYQVTGQSPETQYWATVILKDQGGNKAAYSVVTTTTAAAGSDGLDSQAGDIAALEALYTSTNGDTWTDTKTYKDGVDRQGDATGWAASGMSLDPAPYGVTVETIGGELRVTAVDLRINGLGGSGVDSLGGSIPIELQNLKKCETFDIRMNFLTGELPAELSGMTSIVSMRLSGDYNEEPNYISGGYHVGKSPNASNRFTGGLKPEWQSWTNIEEFQLERQGQMSGTLPPEWSTWTKIKFFSIYGEFRDYTSGFSGTLPTEWSTWSEMVVFTCGRSALTGGLPSEWSTWTKCKTFWPGGSSLNTRPPDSWSTWTIKHYFADRTKPTGVFPTMPFDGSWPELITFSFAWPEGSEYGYTGSLPDTFNNVPNLNQFAFSGHKLSGAIPASMATGVDTGAEIMNLGWQDSGYGFTSIPDDWTGWRRSASGNRYFRCTDNPITGPIPAILPAQRDLHMTDCNFGSVPSGALQLWYKRASWQRDSGTADSGTTTTLVDNSKSWTTDEWVGHILEVAGEYRIITSNTATEITVDEAFSFSVSTQAYDIGESNARELNIGGNRLTPKDLHPAIGNLGSVSYSYGSQKAFDFVDSISASPGTTVVMDLSEYDYTGNSYQWYKDGVALSDGGDISGATTHTLTIQNAEAADDAEYTLQIDHGSFTQTFESQPRILTVE